jgi:hypothetical protein
MSVRFSNNAKTTVTGLSTDRKLVTVQDASTFPDITGVGDYMYVTFASGVNTELIKATSIVFGTGTIQLDTALGPNLDVGSFVELRMTSELLSDLITLHSHDLSGLDSVNLSTPDLGQVLTYNGAAWTNSTSSGEGGAGSAPGVLDGGSALSTYGENAEGGSGQGVTVYANATELAAATLVTGALAYVQDIDKLFLCTGTAWSTLAVSNAPPTVSFSATAIDTNYQVPAWPGHDFITVTASDPDGTIPEVTVLSNSMAGVVIDITGNSLVKVTPNISNAYTGNFVIKITDGEHVVLQTITVIYAFSQNIVGQQNFFSTGTWIVPEYVYEVSFMLIGGGMGGGGVTKWGNGKTSWPSASSYSPKYGSYGYASERRIGTMSVTPNTTYTITVGEGSSGAIGPWYAGGWSGYSAADGDDTSFGSITASGGSPNQSAGSGASADSSWAGGNTGAAGSRGGVPSGDTSNMNPTVYRSIGSAGKDGAVRLIWGNYNGTMRSFNTGNGTGDL